MQSAEKTCTAGETVYTAERVFTSPDRERAVAEKVYTVSETKLTEAEKFYLEAVGAGVGGEEGACRGEELKGVE